MSSDFWAGYISGAVGILVGNPLDVVKVRLQAGALLPGSSFPKAATESLAAGVAAPVLGYGALNALLFLSYNRSESALRKSLFPDNNLVASWLAGAVGGLATWVVSTPTELVKCRAQISTTQNSSWRIARSIWQTDGVRGYYVGGWVTAVRDSAGYGFYFLSYELANKYWPSAGRQDDDIHSFRHKAFRFFVCGGFAGVIAWASVYPLDTIKTRIQIQALSYSTETQPLRQPLSVRNSQWLRRPGSLEIARLLFREGGVGIFFRGLTICSIRAFVVNAAQWAVYEWVKMESTFEGYRKSESPPSVQY